MSSNETKQENKHSPMPWQVVENCRLIDADGFQVCVVGCSNSPELPLIQSEKCDVNLIAAAPDLFHAVNQALDFMEMNKTQAPLTIRVLRKALDKARGV